MGYIDINDSDNGTGNATAANQVTEIALLTSIDSKEPTLGQKTMAGSEPVVIASDQSTIPVRDFGGKLVPEPYDEIDLTYIVAGNGTGQIGTVLYKKATVLIATLTLTYDASNRLIQVVRS